MPLTPYSLDNFIAPKLSLLKTCSAPELDADSTWLDRFILNSMFVVPIDPTNPRRTCIVAVLRRAEAAFLSYRKARERLIDYVQPRPNRIFSLYFESLMYFEMCLSQWTQAADILRSAIDIDYFTKDDGSKEQRINNLYNDSKHLDERRAKGKLMDAKATLWITNDGLEGCSGTVLSFVELHEVLSELRSLAEQVSSFGKSNAQS
jgi:hypothetical protein